MNRTLEHNRNISESLKGRPVSRETREKIRKSNLGQKRSLETRRKMSQSRKGRVASEETKLKMSLARLGKKLTPMSDEAKRNIGKAVRGRKYSVEARAVFWGIDRRKRYAEMFKGEKSSLWKGGITPLHRHLRTTLAYKLWREAVFKRDNWTCVFCGAKGVRLNADHIKPFSLYPELRFNLDNGRTLCVSCHLQTDTFGTRLSNKLKKK